MRKTVFAIALLTLGGCNNPPAPASSQSSVTYHLTIVELNGDGPPTVSERTITSAEQQRDVAGIGESQSAITHDTGCNAADLRMFDKVSYAGNEICFRHAGTATLANFTRTVSPPTTWQAATKSYLAGESGGHFTDGSGGKGTFQPYTLHPTAGTPAQNSVTVTLLAPTDMGAPDDMPPPPHDLSGTGSDLGSSDLH